MKKEIIKFIFTTLIILGFILLGAFVFKAIIKNSKTEVSNEIGNKTLQTEVQEINEDEKVKDYVGEYTIEQLDDSLLSTCRDCDDKSNIRMQVEELYPGIEEGYIDDRYETPDRYSEQNTPETMQEYPEEIGDFCIKYPEMCD